MEAIAVQYTFNVYDSHLVPIGEATILPSGSMQITIPTTPLGRQMTKRLVMGESNKLVLNDVNIPN